VTASATSGGISRPDALPFSTAASFGEVRLGQRPAVSVEVTVPSSGFLIYRLCELQIECLPIGVSMVWCYRQWWKPWNHRRCGRSPAAVAVFISRNRYRLTLTRMGQHQPTGTHPSFSNRPVANVDEPSTSSPAFHNTVIPTSRRPSRGRTVHRCPACPDARLALTSANGRSALLQGDREVNTCKQRLSTKW
jgi:hypothetical protein